MGGGAARLPKARPVPGDHNPRRSTPTRASGRSAHARGNLGKARACEGDSATPKIEGAAETGECSKSGRAKQSEKFDACMCECTLASFV